MSEKQDRVYPRTASDVDRRIIGVSFAELMGISRDLQTHYVELEESVHEVKEIATKLDEWKISVEDDVSSIASIEAKTKDNEASINSLAEWKGSVEVEVASIASIELRVSAAESTIEILSKYGDGETDSIAALVTRVTELEADVVSLASWKDETIISIASIEQVANAAKASTEIFATWKDETITNLARIEQEVDAAKASIGIFVENGEVKGGVLIEAINGETAAKISVDKLDIDGKTLNIKVEATNIEGKLTAEQIDADELKVKATNVTGTLTADQIDATNLKVYDANFEGTLTAAKIDVDGVFDAMKGEFDWLIAGIVNADFVEALSVKVSTAQITGLLSANNIDVEGVIMAGSAYIESIVANEISASELTVDAGNVTGTLTAGQIDCFGVINTAQADIIELVASKVNASYIEGFELNFTHGTIGAFEIFANSLRSSEWQTMTNTLGEGHHGIYIGYDGISFGAYYEKSDGGYYAPTFTVNADGVVRGTDITAFDTNGKTSLSMKDGRFRVTPDIRWVNDSQVVLPLMQINYGGVSKCLVAMLPYSEPGQSPDLSGFWELAILDTALVDSHYFG